MSYATGPCAKCGGDEWGTRYRRYTTKSGERRVYTSRYCMVCNRARARRNDRAAFPVTRTDLNAVADRLGIDRDTAAALLAGDGQ